MSFPDKAWKRLVGCLFLSRLSFSPRIPILQIQSYFLRSFFSLFLFKLFYKVEIHKVENYRRNYRTVFNITVFNRTHSQFTTFISTNFLLSMLQLIFQSCSHFCPCIFQFFSHSSVDKGGKFYSHLLSRIVPRVESNCVSSIRGQPICLARIRVDRCFVTG